jgi:hypothetical protein
MEDQNSYPLLPSKTQMNITNLYIKFCEHIVCSIEISNRTHGISLLDQTNPELTKMKKNKPKTKWLKQNYNSSKEFQGACKQL